MLGLRPLGLVDFGPLVVVDGLEVGLGVAPHDLEEVFRYGRPSKPPPIWVAFRF